MGKDYRIGLVVGLILAGIALIWVATRPGLSPQPQPASLSQGSDQGSLRADDLVTSQHSIAASEVNKPKPDEVSRAASGGRKAQDREQRTVMRPPSSGSPTQTVRDGNEPTKTTRFHVVRQGETLSAIAQQHYGSSASWRKILTANEKTIKDANKIAPGTKLILPE